MPVYDVAPYLRACLDSVVAAAERVEGRASVEIVCVDDGSTDGSGEILESWAAPFGSGHPGISVRVIRQTNAGVSAARNAALDIAAGDWICFVDADDTVSERWFEVALGLIGSNPGAEIVRIVPLVSVRDERGPRGISKHERWWLDRETAAREARQADVADVRVRKGPSVRVAGLHEYSRYGWPMQNFVRRDFIGALRFPAGVRLKEDVWFFVCLADRLTYWVVAEFPGYLYTRRAGSAVMRHRSDEDGLKFVSVMLALLSGRAGGPGPSGEFVRAVSTAIGYEFVQWAEERDPKLPYDPKVCPIRAAWRQAWKEGKIDLGDMPFFWRPAIRWWLRTGQLWLAKVTRRVREWLARFI